MVDLAAEPAGKDQGREANRAPMIVFKNGEPTCRGKKGRVRSTWGGGDS